MRIIITDNNNNKFVEIEISRNDLPDDEIIRIASSYKLKSDGLIKVENDDGSNKREFALPKMPDSTPMPTISNEIIEYNRKINEKLREYAKKELEKEGIFEPTKKINLNYY